MTPSTVALDELTFVEAVPKSLRCVCLGGNPPPDLQIYRDDHLVMSGFTGSQATMILDAGEELGLRRFDYRTERWTPGLNLTKEDDGTVFRCKAVVSTYTRVLETAIRIVVNRKFRENIIRKTLKVH